MKRARLALVIAASFEALCAADPAPLDGGTDRSDEAKALVQRGIDIARNDDKSLDKFLDDFRIPEADAWFKRVFGEDIGERMSKRYPTEFDRSRAHMAEMFRSLAKGTGEVHVWVTRCSRPAKDKPRMGLVLKAVKGAVSIYQVMASAEGQPAEYDQDLVFVSDGLRVCPYEIEEEAIRPEDKCAMKLQNILGASGMIWMMNSRYPVSLGEIATDKDVLRCPCHPDVDSGYEYFYPFQEDATNAKALFAWDKTPHTDGTRNVLLFNGDVETLADAEFSKRLSAQRKASVAGIKKALESNDSWPPKSDEKDPPRKQRRVILERMLKECESEK